MRVLYSHRTRSGDGQFVHIRELTDALRARGHDVIEAGPGAGDRTMLDANSGGAPAWLPAPVYECAEYGYSILAYRRLKRLASHLPPDILYERYNLFYRAGVRLKRRLGAPLMLEVNAPLAEERADHGRLFWKSFARASETAIWRAADAAFAVSNVLAERIRAAGVAHDDVHVVHNGAGPAFLADRDGGATRARLGLEGKIVLGFAGFMRDWHGLDRAVEFIAGQRRSDLHLLLVGDGPARTGLEALARKRGVADQVAVTGVIQRDAAPDHVAAFDIALQPAATAYASPLKLFEYMALGKAVVAPDQANIREVLTDGEDAMLFEASAPGAFDKAIGALLENADLRGRLGAAARATLIRRDFTWAGNARRVEAVAERLLRRRL